MSSEGLSWDSRRGWKVATSADSVNRIKQPRKQEPDPRRPAFEGILKSGQLLPIASLLDVLELEGSLEIDLSPSFTQHSRFPSTIPQDASSLNLP